MVRNPGKFGKAKRGGGHAFSRHLALDEDGVAAPTDKWGKPKGQNDGEDDDDSSEEEEEESEEESEEEVAPAATSKQPDPTLGRAERKEEKKRLAQEKAGKQKKEGDDEDSEDDADLVNLNRTAAKGLSIKDLAAPREISRREREQKEKQEAKDRYWKLHEEGKTDQAKADLARLAAVRKSREEAQAKRKAEADAKTAGLEAKKGATKQKR